MEAQKEEPIPAQMEAPLPSMCVDWEGTRWSAGTGERIHPLSQDIFKTGVGVLPLAFLIWISLLFYYSIGTLGEAYRQYSVQYEEQEAIQVPK